MPGNVELVRPLGPPASGNTDSPGAFIGFFGFMVICCVAMLLLHRHYKKARVPRARRSHLPRARLWRRRG